ncbi:SNF2-related protein [Cupriavidus gilardii]|uniref:SNF2-related protein n=1 Tax=Cupriavidus gilardii TaxID=82541 RepID=A0ABY4VK12_9BURK|nr:SNF2-related protein [Cupriavidus gilardii]USE77560.1 SNF2-related protein [Cupriavidus gilardii]
MFKLFKKAPAPKNRGWQRRWSEAGIHVTPCSSLGNGIELGDPMLVGYLSQMADEGFAVETSEGYLIGWDELYAALASPSYTALPDALALPSFATARAILRSSNSLTDGTFSIAIAGWRLEDGRRIDTRPVGPLLEVEGQQSLLQPRQWSLLREVVSFAKRPESERNDLSHRQRWGRIRKLAVAADAQLDDFLHRSVVLTPEKLQIGLRKSSAVTDDRVVEIEPTFDGAPTNWLASFDRAKQVRDRYDIVTPDGIVQVLISPKVRTVLQEVKRLPGRRVAGARAQAFLLNPYSTLGADANDVIEEGQLEKAREDAGLAYERFAPVFERDGSGYPRRVGLLIETATAAGPASSETQWLDDARLSSFVQALDRARSMRYQLLAWDGFDLVLDGNAENHLADLRDALARRQTPPPLVSYEQVHNLAGYSARIEGIGVEKPYNSPYIEKKNDGSSWFPDNVRANWTIPRSDGGTPMDVSLSREQVRRLKAELAEAELAGKAEIVSAVLPGRVAVDDAKKLVQASEQAFEDFSTGKTPDGATWDKVNNHLGPKKQLVLRANIQVLEYEELRREALQAVPVQPRIPAGIRPGFSLMPHQLAGLAWMQHLYSLQTEYHVRGAVLADDMGLGKTFQLLALMASLREREPDLPPMLVVAPVSLLENWAEEADRFFMPGTLRVLTAYGDSLAALRVPRAQIEQRLLAEDGLVKFLRPDWIGDANVVLTTYETLRDLEFSFAAQRWSLMVCDEAQRIKNPAAMVTRAAKKQNADFRIACTGTPVENTLADMWCLFDYVQPGLLGALNDFGQRYRKPIEAKTDDERARVEELRAKIEPQILRRLKADVAKDLPPKIIDEACKSLPLSQVQRSLYAQAIESFKKREDPAAGSPFKNHLGLLHYLRLVCTDPRRHGLSVFTSEALQDYREKSPKLDWLLRQLRDIKARGEKVIVFCEFRDIQRLLQHYIESEFGFRPDIINGDTTTAPAHAASRQKRIKAFQSAEGFGVLVLSPVAVGFGVNIQAANHVVHYTRTWNPAKEDQATDRAYRIGQKKPVHVYCPVVRADDFVTFDVKLDQLLSYKRELAEDMLNGAGDLTPGNFDLAEVVPGAYANDIDPRVTLDMALRMTWQHFECLAASLWNKRGYASYRTPGTSDNGVDVVALNGIKGQLVQAKTSRNEGTTLGWDAVKDVVTGEAFYRRRHPGVTFQKVSLTNQYFNRQAHENAALNGVELLEQPELAKMLLEYEVTMLDVERMLYADWQPAGIEPD